MINKRIILFLLLLIGMYVMALSNTDFDKYHSSYISSLNNRFEIIGIDEGLSSSSITCIYKDSQSFLWFGTYNGLSLYNGQDFITYKYDNSNTKSLSNNLIYSIAEDTDSSLWIGTMGGGVNRFDIKSEKFERFDCESSDSSSIGGCIVKSIIPTSEDVWLATENGLSCLNKEYKTCSHFRFFNNNEDNFVNILFKSKNGILWIGTNNGLIGFDITKKEIIKHINNTSIGIDSTLPLKVISITDDNKGNLWLGTWGHGLFYYDIENNSFKSYNIKNAINKISNNIVTSLHIDKKNRLWIGTRGSGIDILNITTHEIRNVRNNPFDNQSLSSDIVHCIMEDEGGVLWIGTEYGGINKYYTTHEKFRSYRYFGTESCKLHFYVPTYLMEHSSNILWIGGLGGCSIYDREKNISEFLPFLYEGKQFESGNIYSITEDYDKTVWIGSDGGGLLHYNPENKNSKYYTHNSSDSGSIGQNNIYSALLDSKNQLWFATQNKGLYLYNRKTKSFINLPVLINGKEIHLQIKYLKEDTKGNILIGTRQNGLIVYNQTNKTFLQYLKNNDLPNNISENNINCIFEDSDSVVWIGTLDGGLNKFCQKTNSFKKYQKKNGLSDDRIYAIEQDKNGYLWISTSNGLCKFDIKNEYFIPFYKYDGLLNNEFQIRSSAHLHSGELLFGTKGGIVIFNPSDITRNYRRPQVVITGVKLFNEKLSPNQPLKDGRVLLKNPAQYTKQIEFNYDDRVISIEFALLDYEATSKIYSYKLEGFDENWTTTTQNNVTYTNLPEGNYNLMIKGANKNTALFSDPISIDITITPPFWRKLWVRICMVILILALVYFAYKLRMRRVYIRQLALEEEVRKRTVEIKSINSELVSKTEALAKSNIMLKKRQIFIEAQSEKLSMQKSELQKINNSLRKSNETKNKLFSIISHDIRSPFSSIMGFSDLLYKRIETLEKEKIKSFAQNINLSSQKVLHLLDNLLYWAKSQQSGIVYAPQFFNLKEIVDYSISLYTENAKTKNISIVQRNINSDFSIYADKDMLITIIRNLLNNAIKFTPDNGEILIFSKISDNNIVIGVKDSGIGIPSELHDKILNENNTTSTPGTKNEKGTGLGLILCKEFVDMHKGEIWFETIENKGTVFFISIPLV